MISCGDVIIIGQKNSVYSQLASEPRSCLLPEAVEKVVTQGIINYSLNSEPLYIFEQDK